MQFLDTKTKFFGFGLVGVSLLYNLPAPQIVIVSDFTDLGLELLRVFLLLAELVGQPLNKTFVLRDLFFLQLADVLYFILELLLLYVFQFQRFLKLLLFLLSLKKLIAGRSLFTFQFMDPFLQNGYTVFKIVNQLISPLLVLSQFDLCLLVYLRDDLAFVLLLGLLDEYLLLLFEILNSLFLFNLLLFNLSFEDLIFSFVFDQLGLFAGQSLHQQGKSLLDLFGLSVRMGSLGLQLLGLLVSQLLLLLHDLDVQLEGVDLVGFDLEDAQLVEEF